MSSEEEIVLKIYQNDNEKIEIDDNKVTEGDQEENKGNQEDERHQEENDGNQEEIEGNQEENDEDQDEEKSKISSVKTYSTEEEANDKSDDKEDYEIDNNVLKEIEIEKLNEIIREERCTFGLGSTSKINYICSCSTKEFYPICFYCYHSCHKGGRNGHSFVKILEHKDKIFDCMCGMKNHKTPENYNTESFNTCFYGKILLDTHQESVYYSNDDQTVCNYCLYICNEKSIQSSYKKLKIVSTECECPKHRIHNSVNLISEFYKYIKDYTYKFLEVKNFNVNFLNLLLSKEIFEKNRIHLIIKKHISRRADIIKNNNNTNEQEELLRDENFKLFSGNWEFKVLLEVISLSVKRNKNPNVSLYLTDLMEIQSNDQNEEEDDEEKLIDNKEEVSESYQLLRGIKKDKKPITNIKIDKKVLLELSGEVVPLNQQKENLTSQNFKEYFTSKVYFIELIYYLFYKSKIIQNNIINCNGHCITTMDFIQRYVYFSKGSKFDNFKKIAKEKALQKNSKSGNDIKDLKTNVDLIKKLTESELKANDIIQVILIQFNEMINKFKGMFNLKDVKKPFMILNRIMKDLIKYNMVDDLDKQEYFMLLEESFKLNDKDDTLYGEILIIKSIFYSLLYKNDLRLMKNLQGEPKNNQEYCFVAHNTLNDIISNVLLIIVNNKKNYLKNKKVEEDNLYTSDLEKLKKRISYEKRNRRFLKFDFYLSRIISLMVGRSEDYGKSIRKLKYLNNLDIFKHFQDNPYDKYLEIQEKIVDYLDQKGVFTKTFEIGDNLFELNRKYFHYEVSFINYLKDVTQLTIKLKNLIEENVNSVPLKKKYVFLEEKDFLTEKSKKDFYIFKDSAKYTNIIQAISGLIYIYAEQRSHNGHIDISSIEDLKIPLDSNRDISSKDMFLPILTYLFIIFWKDEQITPILSCLNKKSFVHTFIECGSFFYYFMESIMDAFFGRFTSSVEMDNYNYYSSLVTELILLIEFDKLESLKFEIDNNTLENEKEVKIYNYDIKVSNLFNHISYCMKFCSKAIKNLSLFRNRIIDLIEIMLNKIAFINKNKIFNLEKEEFFKNVQSPKYNYEKIINFQGKSDNIFAKKIKYEKIEFMLKNYFQFMNEIVTTDLKFFNFYDPNIHYLMKETEILEQLDKKSYIDIELTMRIFLHKNMFYLRHNPSHIRDLFIKKKSRGKDRIQKFKDNFQKNLYSEDEFNKKIFKNYYMKDEKFGFLGKEDCKDSLNKKAEYLINLMSESSGFLDLVMKGSKKIKSLIKRRLLLLRYFEHSYVRSTYNLVNQFIFKGQKMTGIDTNQIYHLVLNFLKCVLNFYRNILHVDTLEDISTLELTLFESEFFDLYQLECIYLVFPSDYKINGGITKEKFYNYLSRLENIINEMIDHIKYFEVDKIINILNDNLKIILICDDILENKLLKTTKYEEIADTSIQSSDASSHNDDVFDRLDKDFHRASRKCIEKNRALVRRINVAHNELFDPIAVGFFEYIYKILMNNLTGANYFYNNNKQVDGNDYINIYKDKNYIRKLENVEQESPFVLRNFGYLISLNSLLSHDIMTGQKIFYELFRIKLNDEKICVEDPLIQFIKYLFRIGIFSAVIYECSKVYQIDQISKSNMLCFNLAQECIKFFVLLCKGNNNFFQHMLCNIQVEFINTKTPMMNLIFESMKELVNHSHFKDESLFNKNRRFKNMNSLSILFQKLSDLLVEMIQGVDSRNFEKFFENKKAGNTKINLTNLNKEPEGTHTLNSSLISKDSNDSDVSFKNLLLLMKHFFEEDQHKYTEETVPFKIKIFQIVNNMMMNEDSISEVSKNFTEIFKPDDVILYVTYYFKKLINDYSIQKIEKEEEEKVGYIVIDDELYLQMQGVFQDPSNKIGTSQHFRLGTTMFMYIILLSKKNGNQAATKILKYALYKSEEINDKISKNSLVEKSENKISSIKIDRNLSEYTDKSYSAAFFCNIIKYCEIVIRKDTESYFDMKLLDKYLTVDQIFSRSRKTKNIQENVPIKNVYFILDHRNYLIPNNKIKKFLDSIGITSPSVKLQFFLDQVELTYEEIKYNLKKEINKKDVSITKKIESHKSKIVSNKYNFYFKSEESLALFNLVTGILINLLIIFNYCGDSFFESYTYYFILVACLTTIFFNIAYFQNFIKEKYSFQVKMELIRLEINKREAKSKLKSRQLFDIYIKNVFYNKEMMILFLNVLVPLSCLLFRYAIVLFPLQLFTLILFIKTINEIVNAFCYKYDELLVMIILLLILVIFYSNIGFFFMPSQFEIQLDDGEKINACANLLECVISYFNFGIRSGGGIGDVIGAVSYSDGSWYVLRFIFDMIFYVTVILLIMNMINGIIISTFGALREYDEKIEEEREGKCFICSVPKTVFEKYKVEFAEHENQQHQVLNYVRYFLYLFMSDSRELNSQETYVKTCLKNKDTSFFPILRSIALENCDNFKNSDYTADDEVDEE